MDQSRNEVKPTYGGIPASSDPDSKKQGGEHTIRRQHTIKRRGESAEQTDPDPLGKFLVR